MAQDYYKIPVVLGEKSFKDFVRFDVMTRQGKWKKPIYLLLAFYISATLCFALQDDVEIAFLFGSIFVIIGVFIPTNFFRTFTNSMNEQTKRMNLKPAREVYTIHLSSRANGISYEYPGQKKAGATHNWKNIYGVWKTGSAIYLYLTDSKALLIPDNNKNQDYEGIWNFICSNLDESRIHESKIKSPLLAKFMK